MTKPHYEVVAAIIKKTTKYFVVKEKMLNVLIN